MATAPGPSRFLPVLCPRPSRSLFPGLSSSRRVRTLEADRLGPVRLLLLLLALGSWSGPQFARLCSGHSAASVTELLWG